MAVVYERELRARLDTAHANLRAAEAVQVKRAAEYRSTTDGMAEAMRHIELTTDPKARQKLLALQVEAEEAARSEYIERKRRWGPRPGDGPLMALPCGTNVALSRALITHRVMGAARTDSGSGTTKVTLLRLRGEERIRTSFTVPAERPSASLAEAVAELRASHPNRFGRFFDDIAESVSAALGQAAPR